MALRKTLKCPKCNRRFSMPGHLARHMNALHSGAGGKKRGRHRKMQGRPPKMRKTRRVASRSGLGRMSLEQLQNLIDSARVEAKRQLKRLQAAFR